MPNFWCDLTRIFLDYFLAILLVSFCRIMSAGNPQRRVRQRTEGDRAAIRAKIMDRPVIAE
jgi:K+-transporting ATPase A subunit